jgi:hypothetical protein
MDIKATLDQAIIAIKAGHKAEARRLLESVLDADERNEQAWLWMSGVVESQEERIICLENVLTVNPHNETARKGLAALDIAPLTDQAIAPHGPEVLYEPYPAAEGHPPTTPWPAARTESPAGDAPADQPHTPDSRIFIAITIVLVLLLICTVLSIIAFVALSPTG